jgi:alkylated DNA repair dioxygenase AlkB
MTAKLIRNAVMAKDDTGPDQMSDAAGTIGPMAPADPVVDEGVPTVRTDAPVERVQLDDTSWVDIVRGWIAHPLPLYRTLVEDTAWSQQQLFRYERHVAEPRLTSWCDPARSVPHPAILEAHRDLRARYRVPFEALALAWYRDGRDSVAFHRDTDLRWLDDTVIAIASLGATRPFLLRPRANRYKHDAPMKGATHDLQPAAGDLLVLGGASQVHWEHSVPKVSAATAGRISLQWRWTSMHGRPEQGGPYRAPRFFSR